QSFYSILKSRIAILLRSPEPIDFGLFLCQFFAVEKYIFATYSLYPFNLLCELGSIELFITDLSQKRAS
ncbi:MAG: hypothetical protein Q8L04_00055, partial [Ignavibacteria bacterium]|nr:hypothetical protein [Ignavibacteria bacterium]